MTEEKSIDRAIIDVDSQISEHRKDAGRVFLFLTIASALLLGASYSVYWIQSVKVRDQISDIYVDTKRMVEIIESTSKQTAGNSIRSVSNIDALDDLGMRMMNVYNSAQKPIDSSLIYVFVAVFIVVFGVSMALYRFYLTEISRAQQYRLGLMRIRIAANNSDTSGFDSEVRQSLTADAFVYSTGKDKKVESPVPGHPGVDAGALLVNKIFDKFDVALKPKD